MLGNVILIVITVATTLSLAAPTPAAPAQTVITLNPNTTYQTITGWEATAQAAQDEYPAFFASIQQNLLDRLADADANGNPVPDGLGISRFRLEVHQDNTTGLGFLKSPYRNFDLDGQIDKIVVPVKQRLSQRGEAVWVNVTVVDPAYDGNPSGYANAVLAVYQHMRNKYGFVPDSWEVALEPDNFGWSSPTSVISNGIAAAQLLQANGFPVYLIVPSSACGPDNALNYFGLMTPAQYQGQPALPFIRQYVKEFAYHRYCGTSDSTLQQIANLRISALNSYGISVDTAQLEHIGADYNELHADLKKANVSAWQQYVIAKPYDWGQGADDGSAYYFQATSGGPVQMSARTKFLRQYFKFIRPGATRIEASGDTTFDPVAFVNRDGRYVVVVKATAGGSFSIQGLPAGTYGTKYTIDNLYDVDLSDVTIDSNQALSASIPSWGVITVYAKTAPAAPYDVFFPSVLK